MGMKTKVKRLAVGNSFEHLYEACRVDCILGEAGCAMKVERLVCASCMEV